MSGNKIQGLVMEQNELDKTSDQFFNFVDTLFQANLAKMTAGISPAALATAYFAWLAQLSQSPAAGRLSLEGQYIVAENIHLLTFVVSTEGTMLLLGVLFTKFI